MRANTRRDTGPELALRSALHRSGLRFRVDYPIPTEGRPVRADVAFPRARLAVFLDSCFWHQCPQHATTPKANAAYWRPKLARNVERDREQDARLRAAGWRVLRIWGHVPPGEAVDLVLRAIADD
jgi:DNA mismatch endonuclease (patch repair protein)